MLERQQGKTSTVLRRPTARERKIAAVISAGIVFFFGALWLLQGIGFDFGLLFGPCGLRMRTGWTCPTCGMTTATLAFARGDVLTAFYVQPAAAFLCSVLVIITFFAFLISVFGVYFCFLDRLLAEIKLWHVAIGLIVILAAGWAVTLARAWAV